jgi:hypothetical protein
MGTNNDILAAMSKMPDISIDPESGRRTINSNKTLGQKYGMNPLDPKGEPIAPELTEQQKSETRETVEAYWKMLGKPIPTEEEREQLIEENKPLDVKVLDEKIETNLMAEYVKAIQKRR